MRSLTPPDMTSPLLLFPGLTTHVQKRNSGADVPLALGFSEGVARADLHRFELPTGGVGLQWRALLEQVLEVALLLPGSSLRLIRLTARPAPFLAAQRPACFLEAPLHLVDGSACFVPCSAPSHRPLLS